MYYLYDTRDTALSALDMYRFNCSRFARIACASSIKPCRCPMIELYRKMLTVSSKIFHSHNPLGYNELRGGGIGSILKAAATRADQDPRTKFGGFTCSGVFNLHSIGYSVQNSTFPPYARFQSNFHCALFLLGGTPRRILGGN